MNRANIVIVITCLCFIIAAITVSVRMTYINLAYGAKMKKEIYDESVEQKQLKGETGVILADDGKNLLAYPTMLYNASWDPQTAKRFLATRKPKRTSKTSGLNHLFGQRDEKSNVQVQKNDSSFYTINNLVNLLDQDFKYKNGGKSYSKIIKEGYNSSTRRNIQIAKNLNMEELNLMRTFPFFNLPRYTGGFKYSSIDTMLLADPFVGNRIIGYTSFNGSDAGKGILGAYRDYLVGEKKEFITITDKSNKALKPVDLDKNFFPFDGRDVTTTLNYNIELIAYNALMEQMNRSQAVRGCVIIMDVKTGDVKAIINLSRQDNGNYADDYNHAISYVHQPGSVFKTVSFLIGLKDGYIDLDEKVDIGRGKVHIGGITISDSHIPKENTVISARDVFVTSSNVGTAKLIQKYYKDNPQKFLDGIYKLHLNEKLGIEILGEGKPSVKNTKDKATWYACSLAQTAYGYETMFTPIHLITFYNAIANDGVMVRPRFVKEIGANKKEKEVDFAVNVIDTICSKAVAAEVRQLLAEVVSSPIGTGYSCFKGAAYNFAGKTGTAQVKVGNNYNSSFVGFFPAENPKYTIYALISEPVGSYYAASTAAPVVRKIADRIALCDSSFFKKINIDGNLPSVNEKLREVAYE
ncbi:MAG: penicillin-binding transpeptidase domain-containing protein [Bacteroidales bacterium]|jgi:cell division protein FtsI (penicillin-binding protein 3)|nr:penicillin-binding transpeptidase domain-containing protein [Bacteroidales bacterium]